MAHPERAEDFALAEAVEGFAGQAFQSDAEDDESDVAIVDASAGTCGERDAEGGAEELVAGFIFKNNFSYAGKPDEWANSMRRLTSLRRESFSASEINSGTMAAMGTSRSSSPCS